MFFCPSLLGAPLYLMSTDALVRIDGTPQPQCIIIIQRDLALLVCIFKQHNRL